MNTGFLICKMKIEISTSYDKQYTCKLLVKNQAQISYSVNVSFLSSPLTHILKKFTIE